MSVVDVLGLMLFHAQLQSQCEMSCWMTDAEHLTKNSVYQLSYLGSVDPQFRPNLRSVNPAFVEWVYPVITALHELVASALEHLSKQSDLDLLTSVDL